MFYLLRIIILTRLSYEHVGWYPSAISRYCLLNLVNLMEIWTGLFIQGGIWIKSLVKPVNRVNVSVSILSGSYRLPEILTLFLNIYRCPQQKKHIFVYLTFNTAYILRYGSKFYSKYLKKNNIIFFQNFWKSNIFQ